jgi:hypothetical protein
MDPCPVCEAPADVQGISGSMLSRFSCGKCGTYKVAAAELPRLAQLTAEQRTSLSAILRKEHEAGRSITLSDAESKRLLLHGSTRGA